MGFLDLNIPYHESERQSTEAPKSSVKSRRLKLVSKAMELGYSGVAYNHTIKGVMSESHRCSIPFFPLSSLLLLSPSLSSSVNFHRQLLNVSVSSPFRQYSRLTVIADSPSQSAALNHANHILKTYDIVAVKAVNQLTFELACQTAEVDIISIDFSGKLPFKLNQPMVKAAIERGLYFEITYSTLILDAQVRRQMICNAKLLVDWTRGKNLIISSGAPSLTELRGPYDVANLSSLLGLTLEQAKAANSKNCRSLIANALRKKQYFKEAIKVEVLPSAGQTNFDDWLKWDPISSGEGDVLLDDLEKSFSTACNVPKTAKATDFPSALNGLPSHGLQSTTLVSVMPMAPEPPDIQLEVADSIGKGSEQSSSSNVPPKKDQFSLLNVRNKDRSSSSRKPELSFSVTCTLNNFTNAEEEGDHGVVNDNLGSSEKFDHTERDPNNLPSQSYIANTKGNEETAIFPSSDQIASAEISTPSKGLTLSALHCEESSHSNTVSVDLRMQNIAVNEVLAKTDSRGNKELASASNDLCLEERLVDKQTQMEVRDCSAPAADESPSKGCYKQINIENECLVAKDEQKEEDGNQIEIEDHAGTKYQLSDGSPSGRGRVKRRTSHQNALLPLKRVKKARKL